jgi:hypothetical protein
MKKIVLLLALAGFKAIAADANAQQTNVWSDIDCGQSKLVVPAGLKCQETQEFSGGTGTASAGAGGMFRRWSAFGTVNNVKLYYFLHEAIGTGSNVTATETLEERVRQVGQKTDKNFTPTSPMAGGDYVRYESAAGQPCVGIRKYGPSTSIGFNGSWWALAVFRKARPSPIRTSAALSPRLTIGNSRRFRSPAPQPQRLDPSCV